MPVFEARTEIEASAGDAFRWHERPGAFARLTPPWHRIEVLEASGGIENGARRVMKIGIPPLAVRWAALHEGYEEGRRFVDVQESGPFARWVHEHLFADAGSGRSVLVDRIDYTLPLGAAGDWALGSFTHQGLLRLFRYRSAITACDIARHAPYRNEPPLRVAITGASGMVGQQLAAFLTAGGHEVLRFARGRKAADGEVGWNPEGARIDHEALEGLDAVVHLAGAPIADGRWTPERKAQILSSRVTGTKFLAESLAALREPPKVLLTASGIGIYGNRGVTRVDETAAPGEGFLADVVKKWERAAEPAAAAGIRTVNLRLGIVLSARGGALAKMLLPFKLGLGGPIGDGRQVFSWIALDDVIYAIHHLIRRHDVRGPVNVVAPGALPQREFATELGRVLRRPAVIPLPERAVRGLFGQLGEETLLSGCFVEPAALRRAGFKWDVLRLSDALSR